MSRRRRIAVIVLAVVLVAGVVAWSIVGLLYDGYLTPSVAMAPTLEPGDRVLARSISGNDVSRGDVIIFQPAGQGGRPVEMMSRVVAVGGDVIGQERELLTINGVRAEEPYLAKGTTTPGLQPLTVPEGHVFVMGDNRRNSADSRAFGPLPKEYVRRLVSIQWWPLGELGGL